MRTRLIAALLCALLICAPTAAVAQSGDLEIGAIDSGDHPTVEVKVAVPPELAEINLPPDAFEISENGESRGRPAFGRSADAQEPTPPRTVLLIDTSGSMGGEPITRALAAAESFVQSLRTGSEVAVVTFGDEPKLEIDFTSDVAAVLSQLAAIQVDPSAGTALYDGVRRASRLLQGVADAPESIVLLSDGGDTVRPESEDQVVKQLRHNDVQLWAVGLESSESDPAALINLAGSPRRVLSANADELNDIYVSIASDVSRQYLLRYDSESTGPTRLTVNVDYAGVEETRSRQVTIKGNPQQQSTAETPAVRSPEPFIVTIPFLGTTTAYLTALGALALGSLLIWLLVLGPKRRVTTRERLLATPNTRQRPRLSNIAEWATEQADRRLRGGQLGRVLDRALEGAGLDVRPGELVVMVLSFMVVAYALGVIAAGPLLGIILAAMLPIAARLTLSILQDRRQAAFTDQITDVLQLLAGTLRAGYGLLQGIDAVSRDAEDPAASEFRRIIVENRLGRDINEAMENCAARMNNDDFAWVVQAISIHRDVGGDLAEVLDNIIATVRARSEVHRQVRTLSAEGRLSAIILTALPFVMLVVMHLINPDYIAELTSRSIGWVMLGVAGLLLLIGTVVIRRMVKIRY